jgi:hypothetical protein
MPFAVSKRLAKGEPWRKAFYYVLRRSFLLLAFGFMLGLEWIKTDSVLPMFWLIYHSPIL